MLFDFFDQRGIWISIEFSGVNRFASKIEAGMFKNYWLGNDGDRQWAENAAFFSAFDVLESRLEDVEVTKKNKAFFK